MTLKCGVNIGLQFYTEHIPINCQPDAFFDGVALVVLEIRIQLFQPQSGFLRSQLNPLSVERWDAVDHARHRIW